MYIIETDNNIQKLFVQYGRYIPLLAVLYSSIFILFKYRSNVKKQISIISKFIIFVIINNIFNNFLKGIIQQPRPNKANYTSLFYYDGFGMPSGHAQNMAFITSYLYFLFPKNIAFFIFNLINLSITTIQRIYSNQHTPLQVYIGTIIGFFIGFVGASFSI